MHCGIEPVAVPSKREARSERAQGTSFQDSTPEGPITDVAGIHFLSRLVCNLCSFIARLHSAATTPIPRVVKKTPLNASM